MSAAVRARAAWGAHRPDSSLRLGDGQPNLLAFAGSLGPARRWPGDDLEAAPHRPHARAALVLWGGWLVVTGLVFSLAQGIIHPYYTVALAPAVAAIVGIGTGRSGLAARPFGRGWQWLRPSWRPRSGRSSSSTGYRRGTPSCDRSSWPRAVWRRTAHFLFVLRARIRARVARAFALGVAGVAVLAAPTAYTLATVTTPHSGAIPSAGPASATAAGRLAAAALAGRGRPGGPGGIGAGRSPGTGSAPPDGQGSRGRSPRSRTAASLGPPGGWGARAGGPGGNIGGLLNSSTPSKAITTALKADASKYTWVAAAVGSNESAGYQLASGEPVMAIGGFNGTDPAPSLAQFEKYVSEDKIHYFIASGGGWGPGATVSGSSDDASLITSWVESHFTATTIGGVTVYNLTAGAR